MTPNQAEARAERVAIMVVDGGQSEDAAHRYCDSNPSVYGIRNYEERQETLICHTPKQNSAQ